MRRERPLTHCRNCGIEAGDQGLGLCKACYIYRYRNGLPRPFENVALQRMAAIKRASRRVRA